MVSKSMTAYAKVDGETENVKLKLEIKSVNHRFLDLNFKIPQIYWEYENKIRSIISNVVSRGHIDIFVSREEIKTGENKLQINRPLFEAYLSIYGEVLETYTGAVLSQETIKDILSKKDIIKIQDDDIDKSEEVLLYALLEKALKKLLEMKCIEGESLEKDLKNRFKTIEGIKNNIKDKIKDERQLKTYFENLKDKVQKIISDYNLSLNEERLITEVSIIADKLDITEELVRLESHLNQATLIFKEDVKGRKLEFLLQEIGREFNTIASKINDALIQMHCVEAKSELEKIREQIQNLE